MKGSGRKMECYRGNIGVPSVVERLRLLPGLLTRVNFNDRYRRSWRHKPVQHKFKGKKRATKSDIHPSVCFGLAPREVVLQRS